MTNNISSHNIQLSKEEHRGRLIVLLKFKNRKDWLGSIKQLRDIKFSRTKAFWHIPYTKASFDAFTKLGLPYALPRIHVEGNPSIEKPDSDHESTGIDVNKDIVTTSFPQGKENVDIQARRATEVTWNSEKFIIKMLYDAKNVAFVKKLEASWWNQKSKKWICKATISNLEKIQERWNVWEQSKYEKLYHQIGTTNNPCKISLYYSPKYKDEICIKLIGHGANHQYLKSISGRRYHKHLKIYTVPAIREVTDRVIAYYKDIGYAIENRLEVYKAKSADVSTSEKLDHYLSKFRKEYYSSLKRMVSAMHRQGYGVNTIKQYTGKLARVMDYYNVQNLDDLSVEEVHGFIDHLQREGASFNLVNIVYSALKLYYKIVSTTDHFPIEKLKRPKAGFILPKFLSKGEVVRLFEHVSNLKHKAIIYMLYGSGLRKGEVINLKLEDIYWERNQLLIKGAKGRKDRMTILSKETKYVLETYFHEYKPQVYVFESTMAGKKYGETTINKIIHKAAREANISKTVTPHMLRHSFATHLMDGGVSIVKIQQLLGHKDVKTTLIYTHVSNDDLRNVVSPLDMLKKNITFDDKKGEDIR